MNAGEALGVLRGAGRRLARAEGGLMAVTQTALAQGVIMALNLATGVLTARLLGPEGRGAFAAISIWLMIPALLAVAGLQNALVYEGGRDRAQRPAATVGALLLATAAFAPMAAVCLPLAGWLLRDYGPSVVAAARWALVASVVNVWVVIARQSLLAARDYAAFNLFTACFTGLYLVSLVALGLLGVLTPQSAVAAQLLGTAFVLGVWVPRLTAGWRGAVLLPPRRLLHGLAGYGLRAAPADALAAVGGQMDRVVLVGLIAPAELGLYAVAVAFASVLSVLQTAVSSVMLTDLSGRPHGEIEPFVHRGFRMLLWLLVACCCAVLFVDRALLHLVYGSAFVGAVPVFRVLLLAASLSCLCALLAQAFLASGAPAAPSKAQAAAFACSAAGMFALAPAYGALGAAAALAAGDLVRLALLLVGLRRVGIAPPSPWPRRSDLEPIARRLRARRGAA